MNFCCMSRFRNLNILGFRLMLRFRLGRGLRFGFGLRIFFFQLILKNFF